MARLEAAHWGSVDVGMGLNGAVAIPEPSADASPLSPTDSVDSAIGHSPRPLGSSGKYLTYGGPGFSVAGFDAVTGNVDRIPIPLPLACAEVTDCVAFTQSPVLCLQAVGDTQVWVGTKAGSLHVFELKPDLRFSSHAITVLDSSILCITSRHAGSVRGGEETSLQIALQSMRIDVLLGSSNGVVTIISGEANPNGGLRDPGNSLRKARKVLHLEEDGEQGDEGVGNVNCIVAVQTRGGGEVFWCSYGRKVVVFQRDGWDKIGRLDGSLGCPYDQLPALKEAEIIQLLPTEYGVWSGMSHSSTISLWDTDTLTPKLHITCCNFCDVDLPLSDLPEFSALHFSYPYLFVGTSKGDLIVFRIYKNNTSSTRNSTNTAHLAARAQFTWEYKVLTAEHCGPVPILDIFATPLRTQDEECRSLFQSTMATPTSLQVLVVCGQRDTDSSGIATSRILCYELVASPAPSPLTSPMQIPPRQLSGLDQRCSSVASNSSASSSSTTRRRSSGNFNGVLPKLSFYSATPGALSLLPLRTS